jgi:hypothetical protein
MAGDRIQNHVQVAQNLVVPEPEDYPVLCSQPVVAESVVMILVVVFAIAFHDHSGGQTGEIDNEPSHNYLPAKMTFQLMPLQSSPEHGLRFGHPSLQVACAMLEIPVVGFHPANPCQTQAVI